MSHSHTASNFDLPY